MRSGDSLTAIDGSPQAKGPDAREQRLYIRLWNAPKASVALARFRKDRKFANVEMSVNMLFLNGRFRSDISLVRTIRPVRRDICMIFCRHFALVAAILEHIYL